MCLICSPSKDRECNDLSRIKFFSPITFLVLKNVCNKITRLDHENGGSAAEIPPRRRDAIEDREIDILSSIEGRTEGERENSARNSSPTNHISFSRQFIAPPPIQYRHRFVNHIEDGSDVDGSANGTRFASRLIQEVRSNSTRDNSVVGGRRNFSYAAAAARGAIQPPSLAPNNAPTNPQVHATAANFQREKALGCTELF